MHSRDSLYILGDIILVSMTTIRVEKEKEAPRHR